MLAGRMSALARAAPRAVCVTSSTVLRRTLRRALSAAGAQVEMRDSGEATDGGELLVLDKATRRALGPEGLVAMASGSPTIVLGESIQDDDVLELLRRGVDHVIGEADPDDNEMVVTSVKLLTGDIFGLEKYLAWGARIASRRVCDYEEKREALAAVTSDAKELGARRPLVARIESVVDELLMNALYDAPAVGSDPSCAIRPGVPGPESEALLRWAADGRYFAVSVQDDFGALRKEAILDHVARARNERGRPRSAEEVGDGAGAGLGLYFILSSVTRFVANIEPGKRTEVVCLFDLKASGREAEPCARSLHVFHSPDDAGDE
jgi:hypothetical protein